MPKEPTGTPRAPRTVTPRAVASLTPVAMAPPSAMPTPILDWAFTAKGVANADGSMAATVAGATEVAGPATSPLGPRPTALAFGRGASCRVQLKPGTADPQRFALRVLFRATAPVATRENLVESTGLPVALFLEPGAAPDRFNVAASVANGAVGWAGANTANRVALTVGTWYTASVVYDLDTLALLIDDRVVAVCAFPRGGMAAPSGDQLLVGTWVDGARWPLTGEVAGVQLWRDIPADLEAKLDAERGNPEWHLTRKDNEVRPRLNLGPKSGEFYFDPPTQTYIQPYALAVISYHEPHGAAFEMHGLIVAAWRADENLRRALGPLASDEIDGRRAGSRKSVFQNGTVYWSPASGAVPVLGRLYLDYELIGEGASAIGMPVAREERVAGGIAQRFQSGRMLLRDGGSNAFEVHGAILTRFDATGGVGQWGFPISNEEDVLRGSTAIGRKSEFERCTIFWNSRTGPAIVYGGIRDRYRVEGGPGGDLGFPTSDEANIPGVSGFARYNTFEHGSILWMPGGPFVCRPFRFALGQLDTKEEDRDILDLDGQNDLYCRVCIDVNGGRVFDRKIPQGTNHYPSANVRDLAYTVPYEIVPNAANLTVRLRVEAWESDDGNLFGGGDDSLGTLTKELTIANAWGLAENASGLFRSSGFGPWINHLDWSIKRSVGPNTPFDNFGVLNAGTATVDWREYAAAFSDVDPDFELDFGIVDDGLKALYYELVVKGVAAGGNCFGMALSAIDAWKERSRLGRPLAQYTRWTDVENDFNVKHAYQVGADAIWWFLGQFLSGNTHSPKDVFQGSWDAFNRGMNPVVCIAQNYDFSGAPHCIFPVGWNTGVSPWQMTCFDSNHRNDRTTILVDPTHNTFRYQSGSRVYEGGEWNGGRFHYMPWSVINHRQRTPVWDAILLLLGGVVVIFGDGTDVQSLVDDRGNSIDGAGVKSRDMLKGKLLRVPGMSVAGGPVKGAFYVGKQVRSPWALNPLVMRQLSATLANTLASTLAPTPRAGRLAAGLAAASAIAPTGLLASPVSLQAASASGLLPGLAVAPAVRPPVASDATPASIPGPALLDLVRNGGVAVLRPPQPTDLATIRASLRGKASGSVDAYVKRPLHGVRVQGPTAAGEVVALAFDRLGARDNEIRVQPDRARSYSVTMTSKLGAGRDFVRVRVDGLPSDAAKPARLNAQPGMAALDILAAGGGATGRVTVDGQVDGQPIRGSFGVPLDGGVRLVLPDIQDPARLKVGAIDNLMGPGRAFRTIPRQ